MSELVAGLGVGDVGATGLLVLVVLLILSGRLAPKSAVDRETTRGDEWREAFYKSEERGDMQEKQMAELLEGTRTVVAIVKAMQMPAESHAPQVGGGAS